jgi:uncharacterized protein (DUF433 family)
MHRTLEAEIDESGTVRLKAHVDLPAARRALLTILDDEPPAASPPPSEAPAQLGRCTRKLNDYFDFLAPNDIRLKGHRIGIESILYPHVHDGITAEEIHARFPTLSLEQVYATILYYHHNRRAVEAYLNEWIDFGRRARADQDRNPSPVRRRLRALLTEPEASAPANAAHHPS